MQTIKATGEYGRLSRGRTCAKHLDSGDWARKLGSATVLLDRPGRWMLSTSDGFSRKETIYRDVADGAIPAPSKRFTFAH